MPGINLFLFLSVGYRRLIMQCGVAARSETVRLQPKLQPMYIVFYVSKNTLLIIAQLCSKRMQRLRLYGFANNDFT